MTSTAYAIPVEPVSVTEEIRKSRFITHLMHASTPQQAKAQIQMIKAQHPDARHHCWAFVAGAPYDSQVRGFSDDGEPSGTAGKPMLAQLAGSGVGEILAVVVRYYGGVLLGTGGLVKAYGGGVQAALKLLPTRIRYPEAQYGLVCDYCLFSQLETYFTQHGITVLQADYGEKISLILAVPIAGQDQLAEWLRHISRGELVLTLQD